MFLLGGYLVCGECKKYIKLQPGELPADLSGKCECGGKLEYAGSSDASDTNSALTDKTDKTPTNKPTNKDQAIKYKAFNNKIYEDSALKYKAEHKEENVKYAPVYLTLWFIYKIIVSIFFVSIGFYYYPIGTIIAIPIVLLIWLPLDCNN